MMTHAVAPFITALRWEWFRLSRRIAFRAIMALVAAAVILILLSAVWISAILDAPAPFTFPFFIFLALTVVGPFLGIFLTAIIFSGEYGWGTLRAMLARGSPRWRLAASKLLLASIALAVVWIASWLLASVVGLLAGEPGASYDILPFSNNAPSGWGDVALLYFGNLLAPIAYAGLTALLCVASRSTVFGLAVAAAILIAESTAYPVAVIVVAEIYQIDLYEYLRWTLRGATSGLAGRYDNISAWYFVPAVLAYTALFVGLSLTLLTRRDLPGGSGG